MLTIYGAMRSRVTRNMWLLDELGVPYRHVPVMQAYRKAAADAPITTGSTEFLALSPAGAIPVLDDDGFVLSESLAINLYLARKHGGPLAPRDLREDAQMMQWSLYAATSIEAQALVVSYAYAENRAGRPEGRAEIASASVRLERPLDVIEAHLAKNGHPVGGRFTVADINLAEILRYAQAHAPLFDARPATKAWLSACQTRPAFKAMMEKRLAEPL